MVAEQYINTLKLALRVFSDVSKDKDYFIYKEKIIEFIEKIPSIEYKTTLLGDLAFRLLLAEKRKDFDEIMDGKILKTLEYCADKELFGVKNRILVAIAPCFYEHNQSSFRFEIDNLDIEEKHRALSGVMTYLVSARPFTDPVDLDIRSSAYSIGYPVAQKICEIIELMSIDKYIYSSIKTLVSLLVKMNQYDSRQEQSLRQFRTKHIINERQALIIVERLYTKVLSKLPDKNNITHEGYKISCLAQLAKLRNEYLEKAINQWQKIVPSNQALANSVKTINNSSDRVLVMSWVAEALYSYDPLTSESLMKDASEIIKKIPSIIDRGQRLEIIASTWGSFKDDNSTKFFLTEAMKELAVWEWDSTRDRLTGEILQHAYKIDAEFASSLISFVDNPVIERGLKNYLLVQEITSHPDKDIPNTTSQEELYEIRARVSNDILKDICSGKSSGLQNNDIFFNWISEASDALLQQSFYINASFIESMRMQNSQISVPIMQNSFKGLLDNLQMIWVTGNILNGGENQTIDVLLSNPSIPEGLQLFSVGTAVSAIDNLKNWIANNVKEYLKIYDAFFSPDDLRILQMIPSGTRIHILCHQKSQVEMFDDEKIKESYKEKVDTIITAQSYDIYFHIYGIKKTGEGPIHNRYFITANGQGIELGTSTSGLGNKDSSIRSMSKEEALAFEANYLDKLLFMPPAYYKEERLYVTTFTISK